MDNQAEKQQKNSASQPNTAHEREKEFSEAVERVHRKYGSDLSAFARDFQRDIQKVHKAG